MSHIIDGKMTGKDLDAFEEAGDALGLVLIRGQQTYKWAGYFAGDTAEAIRVANEIGRENIGKCSHVLRRKDHREGIDYEIGLFEMPDGSFKPVYDGWSYGRRLEEAAGVGLSKLRQEYAVAVTARRVKRSLAREGFKMEREQIGARVRLRLKRRG